MNNLLEAQKEYFTEKARLRFLFWYEQKKYRDLVLEGYKDTYFFNPDAKTREDQSLNVAEAIGFIYMYMSMDTKTKEAPHIGPLIFIAFFTMLESIIEEELNYKWFDTRDEALEATKAIEFEKILNYIDFDISKHKENNYWINVKIFKANYPDFDTILTNN